MRALPVWEGEALAGLLSLQTPARVDDLAASRVASMDRMPTGCRPVCQAMPRAGVGEVLRQIK